MHEVAFNKQLARNLAKSFSLMTGLGCTVNEVGGDKALCDFGYTCESCRLCRFLARDWTTCSYTHLYGMAEAERFGGRYIYYCKGGLTFFVSPIIGQMHSSARVTVGPFLMVEAEDFCSCELQGQEELLPLVAEIPSFRPDQATHMSTILYMAVGYLNNVSSLELLRDQDASSKVQQQISAYIMEVKNDERALLYPYALERQLLEMMRDGNSEEANRLLNDILGQILFKSGGSLEQVKAYTNLLLTTMMRAIMEVNRNDQKIDNTIIDYYQQLQKMQDLPQLCNWMVTAANNLMKRAFEFKDARHADAIHRCLQYIQTHLTDKLTLEELSEAALLSPSYFSRVFRRETGQTIQQAIMGARLKKALGMIRYETIKLTDIALMTGFSDSSYFCRSFQRVYGMTPSQYRKNKR